MQDHWFYTLAGAPYGPVRAARIHELVAQGKLPGSEFVWPEGSDVQLAVTAFTALAQTGKLPDWLDDVRRAEHQRADQQPARVPDEPSLPDWLFDVQSEAQNRRRTPTPTPPPPPTAVPSWLDDVRQAEIPPPPPTLEPPVPVAPQPAPPVKPMPAAVTAFLTVLEQQELLRPEQLDELRRGQVGWFPHARALADALVSRRWLTAFQTKLLLANRAEELVVGVYRIVDRLGVGGMGEVFKAWHCRMDRLVALKLIAKNRLSNAISIERFFREVRVAAQLQHPNIVLAYDADRIGDNYYFAMEYVAGTDLRVLLKHGGPLPIPQACSFAQQAALGLQHAHEHGVVHRDIKPSNLLLTKAQGTSSAGVIKILDFGLARLVSEDDQLTQDNAVLGTVDYISPEQASDAGSADIRSDIYGLGCTLFYLLTAQVPFPGKDSVNRLAARVLNPAPPLQRFRPDAPAGLASIVARMLERRPEDRFQLPAELALALDPFCLS